MTTDLRTLLLNPDSAATDILSNVGIATSPFTGGIQTTELPGARWRLTMGYEALEVAAGRRMKAIKALCRGGAELLHVRDWEYLSRRQIEPGVPVTAGGTLGGGTLLYVSGTTPGVLVYEFGDQVSYLDTDGFYRMHMVVGAVVSDGAGLAQIPVLPPIRNAPANGVAVNSIKPAVTCIWREGGEIMIQNVVRAINFVFEEALYGIL